MKKEFAKSFASMAAILAVLVIISSGLAAASGEPCYPVIKLINQDPNPATPGSYVKILFGISGLDNSNCKGLSIKLNPGYPFSLDPGDNGIQTLKGNTFTINSLTNWNVPYTVRVADDALEGTYQLKLISKEGVSEDFSSDFSQKYFNLSVTDAETDFDTVIQGTSGNQVSIGIVNTGKNTANSLVVSIPKQENFTATGITQQIVGNLAIGDYTIVSFNLIPKTTKNPAFQNITKSSNWNAEKNTANKMTPSSAAGEAQLLNNEEQVLNIKIDYTDGIGKRRSITKEVLFSSSLISGNFTGRPGQVQSSTGTILGISWWIVAGIIILILVGGWFAYKKCRNWKDKNGNKKHDHHEEEPDWAAEEKPHVHHKK